MALDAGLVGLRSDVERLQSNQYELLGQVGKLAQRVDWLLLATLLIGGGSLVLSFVVFVVVLVKL